MYCQKCGSEIMTGAVFCGKCGNRVPSISDFDPKLNNEMKDTLTKAVQSFQEGNVGTFDTIYNESKRYIYYTIIKIVGDNSIAECMDKINELERTVNLAKKIASRDRWRKKYK